MMINPGRHTAELDGDFVVFLIGARVNRLRGIPRMARIARQMTAMQKALAQHPEVGCLHTENWFGRTTLAVQYWRDFDSLERFARSADLPHLEAWREFNRLTRETRDIGIWHETYQVRAGAHEAMYVNMPTVGLAAAGLPVAVGSASRARGRIEAAPTGPRL